MGVRIVFERSGSKRDSAVRRGVLKTRSGGFLAPLISADAGVSVASTESHQRSSSLSAEPRSSLLREGDVSRGTISFARSRVRSTFHVEHPSRAQQTSIGRFTWNTSFRTAVASLAGPISWESLPGRQRPAAAPGSCSPPTHDRRPQARATPAHLDPTDRRLRSAARTPLGDHRLRETEQHIPLSSRAIRTTVQPLRRNRCASSAIDQGPLHDLGSPEHAEKRSAVRPPSPKTPYFALPHPARRTPSPATPEGGPSPELPRPRLSREHAVGEWCRRTPDAELGQTLEHARGAFQRDVGRSTRAAGSPPKAQPAGSGDLGLRPPLSSVSRSSDDDIAGGVLTLGPSHHTINFIHGVVHDLAVRR